MTIRVALTHKTQYRYDRLVQLQPQTVRLRPAPHTRTPIVSFSQKIEPANHFLNWQQDPFGNYQARAVFPEKTDHMSITVDVVADMIAINPFDFFLDEEAFFAPFAYGADLQQDLAPYLAEVGSGPLYEKLRAEVLADWHKGDKKDIQTIDFLVSLNQRLESMIGYIVRMEPGVQTPEETLSRAKGSCRDSAWLMVNLLRHVGVAARFVSGYLIQLTADEKPLDGGAAGPDEDFTDLHAWAEAFVPGAGWIGLDPTSGLFAGEGHIPLAATPLPSSAAPISGGLEACEVDFGFEMTVKRLREPARITKPFTDATWNHLDAAGKAVEEKLQANDVRLTIGGEPTFVAATDRDADEWTIGAVGPTKRAYADKLARALRDKFAPGGLLTHGQGKWYPGEPLPRWAFSILWRTDGDPVWQNESLIGAEPEDGKAQGREATVEDAEKLVKGIALALGVQPGYAQAAYEDVAQNLMKEADLPPNLSPENNQLDDPVDRAKLARTFDRGLGTPTGYVLPIQPWQADATGGRSVTWLSEIWEVRRGYLHLIEGDSPAGFRLPLQSLGFLPQTAYPSAFEYDPFEQRRPLPERDGLRRAQHQKLQLGDKDGSKARHKQREEEEKAAKAAAEAAKKRIRDAVELSLDDEDKELFTSSVPVIRTALVVEPRDGTLNIFMPPVGSSEAYVDLVTAIETVAEATEIPVRLEGYPPPNDPRFAEIKVTPDPGVIEVNIHPSADWESLKHKTKTLYEEAKKLGLDASGFMIDGRPTGSGGGAHVTLGGAKPSDSPFLRRPDVLGSLIRFWQNHPSLCYFFSGLFIGPTSQAPRMDEARSDILYELELALNQLPGPDEPDIPFWLVDRVLRHLLVDVTGNTHRSEICIDKLYSPDSSSGRLGLVEFRGFEMPPHWQMNIAQQLILRALVAWFWQTPYSEPLKPFGTELHDRFMLPDVVWHDFGLALAKISAGLGIKLERDWYKAQFDFRFPQAGRIDHDGVTLELRNALEPWHVLGEEGAASGTTRFVDSSLERLQVKLSGAYSTSNLAVTCNGALLPLKATEEPDSQIAGVRFRSWLPASCLHPTIQPHGPLIFDLVDLNEGRAIAGCTYHTTHPGGRNFETRPINALEAEGRRLARFEPFGHTPGRFDVTTPRIDPRFPYTLDMRALSVRG